MSADYSTEQVEQVEEQREYREPRVPLKKLQESVVPDSILPALDD